MFSSALLVNFSYKETNLPKLQRLTINGTVLVHGVALDNAVGDYNKAQDQDKESMKSAQRLKIISALRNELITIGLCVWSSPMDLSMIKENFTLDLKLSPAELDQMVDKMIQKQEIKKKKCLKLEEMFMGEN